MTKAAERHTARLDNAWTGISKVIILMVVDLDSEETDLTVDLGAYAKLEAASR